MLVKVMRPEAVWPLSFETVFRRSGSPALGAGVNISPTDLPVKLRGFYRVDAFQSTLIFRNFARNIEVCSSIVHDDLRIHTAFAVQRRKCVVNCVSAMSVLKKSDSNQRFQTPIPIACLLFRVTWRTADSLTVPFCVVCGGRYLHYDVSDFGNDHW